MDELKLNDDLDKDEGASRTATAMITRGEQICKERPEYKLAAARANCYGEHFAPSQNSYSQPHI